MAYYFGVNNGVGIAGSITDSSSTTGKDIELVINTNANVPSKEDLLLALQKLWDYVIVRDKVW